MNREPDLRMDCTHARELLLDAEPAALRTDDESALSRHLRTCPACAAAARALVGAQHDLDHALVTLTNAAALGQAQAVMPRRLQVKRVLVLAAAAAVLLMLVPRAAERDQEGPIPSVTGARSNAAGPRVIVNVSRSGDVAVLHPTNPNITIIWQLEGADRP